MTDDGPTYLRRLPHVLTQRLPGAPCAVEVELRLDGRETGARAGLAVLGDAFGWIGLEYGPGGGRAARPPVRGGRRGPGAGRVPGLPGARGPGQAADRDRRGGTLPVLVRRRAGFVPSGPVFAATPWRWGGALLGLFAAAPEGPGAAGSATFTHFRVTPC